jgi:hypothetical protein
MATRPVGPQRVGVTRGRPTEELKQRQARNVNDVPVEKRVGSETRKYALGKEVVEVDFGASYVAGTAQAVSISLSYTPTYVQPVSAELTTGTLAAGQSLFVGPANRSAWSNTVVYVVSNYPNVHAVLKVY